MSDIFILHPYTISKKDFSNSDCHLLKYTYFIYQSIIGKISAAHSPSPLDAATEVSIINFNTPSPSLFPTPISRKGHYST